MDKIAKLTCKACRIHGFYWLNMQNCHVLVAFSLHKLTIDKSKKVSWTFPCSKKKNGNLAQAAAIMLQLIEYSLTVRPQVQSSKFCGIQVLFLSQVNVVFFSLKKHEYLLWLVSKIHAIPLIFFSRCYCFVFFWFCFRFTDFALVHFFRMAIHVAKCDGWK